MDRVEWLNAVAKTGRMLTDGRGQEVAERFAQRVLVCSPYPQDKTRRYMDLALPKRYTVTRHRDGCLHLHRFDLTSDKKGEHDAAVA